MVVLWQGVIFVPCDNKQPIRYLLTVNRHDAVKQLRSQLVAALDEDECWDLIITEVFDNHIARVLVSSDLCLLLLPICFTSHSVISFISAVTQHLRCSYLTAFL